MSGMTKLPQEIEELFGYSDGEGLLEPEDLEEAGFSYQEEVDELEIWKKNQTQVKYNPVDRVIENYFRIEQTGEDPSY